MKPPHDPTAERQALGAALRSPTTTAHIAARIGPGDFYVLDHETIWETIQALRSAGKPTDVHTVGQRLIAAGKAPLAVLAVELEAESTTILETVDYHLNLILDASARRQLMELASQATQRLAGDLDPKDIARTMIERIQLIGRAATVESPESAWDVMAGQDDPYDWVIPGLLETRDRLVLTGGEGGGKSTLLRQIAITSAAGIHPFTGERIEPVRTLMIDCENSRVQFRRQSRGMFYAAEKLGDAPPQGNLWLRFESRLDITSGRVLSQAQKWLEETKAQLVIIGPLYRLASRAIQTDDEAGPILSALDELRETGAALILEAHAGHAKDGSGHRNWRPRGSSAMLGWPEFGYGIEPVEDEQHRTVDLRPWRGDRDERSWPTRLKAGGSFPWTPVYDENHEPPPPTTYVPDPEPEPRDDQLWG